MGVDEGNLPVKDLDVILEKLSNKYSSSLWYILTSSDYGDNISHYILYVTSLFVAAGVVRDKPASGSGYIQGF